MHAPPRFLLPDPLTRRWLAPMTDDPVLAVWTAGQAAAASQAAGRAEGAPRIRLALGVAIGYSLASFSPLAVAAQLAVLLALAFVAVRVLDLVADAVLGGTDDLP